MPMLQQVARELQTVFCKAPVEANAKLPVILRKRKFSAVTLAQTFILALLKNPRANSEQIAQMAATLGVEVTASAVEQRYGAALEGFFRSLFESIAKTVIKGDEALASTLERFTEVKLIDSSVISLPESMAGQFPGCGGGAGKNKAALKLQTEMDLRTGTFECVQVEAGKSPDQGTDRQHVAPKPGSLRIADLGYLSIAVLTMISQSGAFFLSRLQHVFNVDAGDGNGPINLIKFLHCHNESQIDQWVTIGRGTTLHCRLIAWRVPKEIAARRRRRLRKTKAKKGRQPSEQALVACDWNYLVTNLDSTQLSVPEAIVLYRGRWQIELLFKRWKSGCKIDLLDGRTDQISMTRFWIRLCGALLQQWLVAISGWSSQQVASFAKIAIAVRDLPIAFALSGFELEKLVETLTRFKSVTRVTCRRTKRRKTPGFIELLRNPELLEYSLT